MSLGGGHMFCRGNPPNPFTAKGVDLSQHLRCYFNTSAFAVFSFTPNPIKIFELHLLSWPCHRWIVDSASGSQKLQNSESKDPHVLPSHSLLPRSKVSDIITHFALPSSQWQARVCILNVSSAKSRKCPSRWQGKTLHITLVYRNYPLTDDGPRSTPIIKRMFCCY